MAKIKLPKIKNGERFTFLGLAVGLFILTIVFVVYGFRFLDSNFNRALGTVSPPPPETRFDIEGFEKLGLIKK